MADLPTVNAIDEGFRTQNNVIKDSISRLQSSIRTGLAMNRREIIKLNETVMKAFNVNEELVELEKEKMKVDYERWLESQRQKKKEDGNKAVDKKIDTSFLSIAGILAGIAAAISAFSTALGAALIAEGVKYQKMFNAMFLKSFGFVSKIFSRIGNTLFPSIMKRLRTIVAAIIMSISAPNNSRLFEQITEMFTKLKGAILKPIRSAIAVITSDGKLIEDIKVLFNNVVTKIRAFFSFIFGPITSGLDDAAKVANSAEDGVGVIQKIKNAVSAFFAPLKTAFSLFEPIIKVVKSIATTVGRLFFPFAIIMGLIDTVSAFSEGFEEGGLLEGIKRGLTKLADVTIFLIPNLIKDAVSFIADFFGFENISKFLDQMSIGELVMEILMFPINALKDAAQGLADFFDIDLGFGDDDEQQKKLAEIKEKQKKKQAEINAKRASEMSNKELIDSGLMDFDDQDERNQLMEELRMKEKADEQDLERMRNEYKDLQSEKRLLQAKNDVAIEGIESGRYSKMGIASQARDDVMFREMQIENLTERMVGLRQQISGAEVDLRSRAVDAERSNQSVNVTAPQTSVDNSSKTNVNNNNVVPASPRRSAPSEQMSDFRDPLWVG